ncbi:EAL domain-containing protein [Rappaport israeli]|uniref:EAL domain-containing protein n=1 Tax=Rappaport israeli TaxID=1839807 RepID=UPI000AF75AE9|nr:EAL domain-containing protein [Rappaport israeli]
MLSSRHTEGLWGVEALLNEALPDIIVLTGTQQPQDMEKLRTYAHTKKWHVPVIVVEPATDGLDKWIRQGAEYAVSRGDILTAIKLVQQIMQYEGKNEALKSLDEKLKAVKQRYDLIYRDLADPVAYVQDGLFISANPAFYKVFAVENEQMLDEMTIMNIVPRKSERNVKALLKNAMEKDFVPVEKLELQTMKDERLEMQVGVAKILINNEPAVQMYFRDLAAGGGGGSGIDQTTGLAGHRMIAAAIAQTQSQTQAEAVLGYWVYLWVENYREVWQKDGLQVAEILMQAVAQETQRFVPSNSEVVRFTDDALALWLKGDKEQTIARMAKLIEQLDKIVPENIGRLIHPMVFAGMFEIKQDTAFYEMVSRSFRSVRALAVGQSGERIAEPTSGELSRKDERRKAEIEQILQEKRLEVWYQPIAMLEPDGVPRFSEVLKLKQSEDKEKNEVDFESLLQAADRFGLGRVIDRIKLDLFTRDILSYEGNQSALNCYLSVSSDSLNDPEFPRWVESQLLQTGIAPSQVVFEFSVDVMTNAFSGAMALVEHMRPQGSRFALTQIGRLDESVESLLSHLNPEVLKLDMREIDTYEEEEEARFMTAIKEYEKEHGAMIIAAEMESPAQLSHVWPYEIQYLQGDGMVPAIRGFNFDFSEPLF